MSETKKTPAELRLIAEGLRDGVWQGILVGAAKGKKPPDLMAVFEGEELDGLALTPRAQMASAWDVSLTLPPKVIQDGTSTVLFQLGDTVLGSFQISAAPKPEGGLEAEVALLRAELDMLKRAFRARARTEQKPEG